MRRRVFIAGPADLVGAGFIEAALKRSIVKQSDETRIVGILVRDAEPLISGGLYRTPINSTLQA
jgi:hypothetical protein